MIKIEKTTMVGRYNLIDDTHLSSSPDFFLKQLSLEDVKALGKSIIDLLSSKTKGR